jgi:uroporphyrin-III C-methyltransferase
MTGKAYLVGAGPGRADLITLRGLTVLRQADAVLYDRLIAPELLDEAPSHAERIFVGKRPGHHAVRQERINELMVRLVRDGLQVVRLKGGDPCVFGHAGEEAAALAAAGLPYEIVPGVSSAIGVPAYAGVPLTQRGVASAFAVVTAHEASETCQWHRLARPGCHAGRWWSSMAPHSSRRGSVRSSSLPGANPLTPAILISRGATAQQRTLRATLATLPEAQKRAMLPPPRHPGRRWTLRR